VAEVAEGATSLNPANELAIRRVLETAGIEFIDENGGGAGVRSESRRKAGRRKTSESSHRGRFGLVNDKPKGRGSND